MFKNLVKVGMVGVIAFLAVGCGSDENIEAMKTFNIPFEDASSYTYGKLADKLNNVEWTKKEEPDSKLNITAVTVTLKGDFTLDGKSGSLTVRNTKIAESKDGKFIKTKVMIDSGEENYITYSKAIFGESCERKGKKRSSHVCPGKLGKIFKSIIEL